MDEELNSQGHHIVSVIQLSNVQKIYPSGQVGIRQVDLKIHQGEFVFVAGASGAGKSTLLRLLYGAEFATSGHVLIDGLSLTHQNRRCVAEIRREIGIVFQDYKLLPRLTVLENVALALEVCRVPRSDRLRLSKAFLDALGLGKKGNVLPLNLSGGEQQRVAIARALVRRPKLLIADEPTGSLDRTMSDVVFELLKEAHQLGVTVVVATHNLLMIEEMALRTVVLDGGEVIGDFNGAVT